MQKITILFLLLSLTTFHVLAQPVLVKDINSGSGDGTIANYLDNKLVIGNYYYFLGDDSTTGFELWRSDGTASGTTLVKDIRSGTSSSEPSDFVNFNGILLFFANDGQNGNELWRSDGTSNGTYIIKNINPGSANAILSVFNELIVMGDYAYFSAFINTTGEELWRTDGTEAGTTMVTEIIPSSLSANPRGFTVMNNILYFAAEGSGIGKELFKSDGTAAGTVLVKDIESGSGSSFPASLVVQGNTLYFTAQQSAIGYELWKSDGTEAGTILVKDLQPGFGSGMDNDQSILFVFNNKLFFVPKLTDNEDDLWISDGTEAGTLLLQSFDNGAFPRPPAGLTIFNNSLYFIGYGNSVATGLWKTDGTMAGTMVVKELSSNFTTSYIDMISIGDRLVFVAKENSTAGFELWESDGTEANTTLTGDIYPGNANSDPFNMANLNGAAIFTAVDGAVGRELWIYNPSVIPVSANISLTQGITCNGDASAVLQVTASGGQAPYTYQWNMAGLSGDNPSNLPAGNYMVTITDDTGGTTTAAYTITEPDPLEVSLSSTPATAGNADGSADAFASGGTPLYSYLWNTTPPQTLGAAFNLASGTYTVTITDANGCSLVGSVVVDMISQTIEEAAFDLEIYPNPATAKIYVQTNHTEPFHWRLSAINGQSILKGEGSSATFIEINELPDGIYFLQVMMAGKNMVRKVVLQK